MTYTKRPGLVGSYMLRCGEYQQLMIGRQAEMYTKAERKQLRQLAEIAYERELALELTRLQTRFSAWQRGEIDPFQLSETIHAFHQGPSRALYSYYNQIDPPLAVARAVVEKLLQENEIPAGVQQKLAAAIAFYRAEQEENG